MRAYNAKDWYWRVGGEDGPIFSSKDGAYVEESDADFQAFTKEGNRPSPIKNDGELALVLMKADLPANTVAAAGLTDLGKAGDALTEDDARSVMAYTGYTEQEIDDTVTAWGSGSKWKLPDSRAEQQSKRKTK